MPVAVAVFDMGKRGHKKNRIAVLFMALVISAYLGKFLISEGLGGAWGIGISEYLFLSLATFSCSVYGFGSFERF